MRVKHLITMVLVGVWAVASGRDGFTSDLRGKSNYARGLISVSTQSYDATWMEPSTFLSQAPSIMTTVVFE